MAIQDKNTLKSYFNTGDRPTEQEFADVIDSALNIHDDKADTTATIDITDDTLFITPKSAKKLIDTHAVIKINNVSPDATGNLQIDNITGTAGSITGSIEKSQVTGLQAELGSKLNSDSLKTINNQSLIGSGNINLNSSNSSSLSLLALPSSSYTIPGTVSPNAFPEDCDTFTLQANKTYFLRGKYLIANGTSHTISMGWNTTGLTISSLEYVAELFSSNLNAYATASTRTQVSGVGLKVLNSSTASPTSTIEFEGILRCTSAGTITPIIAFSTPSYPPLSTMKVGSFIEFTEIGSNMVQAVGAVS